MRPGSGGEYDVTGQNDRCGGTTKAKTVHSARAGGRGEGGGGMYWRGKAPGGGSRRGSAGGWGRLPKRLGAVTVGLAVVVRERAALHRLGPWRGDPPPFQCIPDHHPAPLSDIPVPLEQDAAYLCLHVHCGRARSPRSAGSLARQTVTLTEADEEVHASPCNLCHRDKVERVLKPPALSSILEVLFPHKGTDHRSQASFCDKQQTQPPLLV